MKLDLHTHYYPPAYFERIERSGGDFSFGPSPTGQRIIRFKGARFFGVTAPMTDVAKRLEDMDRVGINTEVLSLSTPNVYFVEGKAQAEVARLAARDREALLRGRVQTAPEYPVARRARRRRDPVPHGAHGFRLARFR